MPEKSPRVITNARQAILVLGEGSLPAGVKYVADLFCIGENTVRMWLTPKRGIPPEAYSELAPRLRAKQCEFSDELFQQYPAVFKPKPPPAKKKNGGNPRSVSRAGK